MKKRTKKYIIIMSLVVNYIIAIATFMLAFPGEVFTFEALVFYILCTIGYILVFATVIL